MLQNGEYGASSRLESFGSVGRKNSVVVIDR